VNNQLCSEKCALSVSARIAELLNYLAVSKMSLPPLMSCMITISYSLSKPVVLGVNLPPD